MASTHRECSTRRLWLPPQHGPAQIHFGGISSSGCESIMPDDELRLPDASWATGSMWSSGMNFFGSAWPQPSSSQHSHSFSPYRCVTIVRRMDTHSKIRYSLLNFHPQRPPAVTGPHLVAARGHPAHPRTHAPPPPPPHGGGANRTARWRLFLRAGVWQGCRPFFLGR
ncbi:unnamed protein product [Vitrella brassicaformis CCMP3155]|uniref:Uncharacterized protein n=1 Tax=Vitrella brassicaformis (strain CCMP3155) TaxID=1169540 RepID=A0A0G4EZE2_VITBC|nr:unnamed protein product [Vitrella brassicaformis CCMP3155]|eukprot:CEM04368.1 unnamed protein product [Vitrella brassicaformis CCMP3155]